VGGGEEAKLKFFTRFLDGGGAGGGEGDEGAFWEKSHFGLVAFDNMFFFICLLVSVLINSPH
jgi:hypothetical protein